MAKFEIETQLEYSIVAKGYVEVLVKHVRQRPATGENGQPMTGDKGETLFVPLGFLCLKVHLRDRAGEIHAVRYSRRKSGETFSWQAPDSIVTPCWYRPDEKKVVKPARDKFPTEKSFVSYLTKKRNIPEHDARGIVALILSRRDEMDRKRQGRRKVSV